MYSGLHTAVAALVVILLGSHTAWSQGAVRFVASTGSDTNQCTRALPCRNLNAALSVVPNGGEVQILDSGEYGPSVTITKSVTISSVGVNATLTQTTDQTAVVFINAPSAQVVLRGLHLNGSGTGEFGVQIDDAAVVHIEQCIVERFTSHGVFTWRNSAKVYVADTILRQNRTGSGLLTQEGEAGAQLAITDTRILDNATGVTLIDFPETTIMNSLVANSRGQGIDAVQNSAAVVVMSTVLANNPLGFLPAYAGSAASVVSHSTIRNSTDAFRGGYVTLSNSTITDNEQGMESVSITFGNNTFGGNDVDYSTTPFMTVSPQ